MSDPARSPGHSRETCDQSLPQDCRDGTDTFEGEHRVLFEENGLRRIVIIDGDTIDVQGERIRILNIDAPESFRSRCEVELKLALRTKERLAQLLHSGPIENNRRGLSGGLA
jgi:hypothetical protein